MRTRRFFGSRDGGTGDGGDALDQRHAPEHRIGDGRGGADVLHHHPDIHRQPPGGNLPAGHGQDQLFLGPLRILDLQGDHLDPAPGAGIFHARRWRRACWPRCRSGPPTPRAFCKMAMPSRTRSASSSISRWSAVRYGSHSTPLRIRVSMVFSSGGESLTWAGKVAPPIPTMPPRPDPLADLVGGELLRVRLLQTVHPGVLAVGPDDHRRKSPAGGVGPRLDGDDLAGGGGMHRHRDEPLGRADHLSLLAPGPPLARRPRRGRRCAGTGE